FLARLGAGFDATALELMEFAIHLLAGLRYGCEQILEGLLPSVDVGCCLGASFAHSGLCQREECFVIGPQRVGAEGLERIAQPGLGIGKRPESFAMDGPFFLDFGLQPVVGGTRRQPADDNPDEKKTETEEYESGRYDRHVLILFLPRDDERKPGL